MTPLLSMRGIVKRFGTVVANDGIDLDVASGRIVGLLGENGSGKTTLMRILFGMLRPDAGDITFKGERLSGKGERLSGKGERLSGHDPRRAMRAGLAMIHQHFTLVEAASVAENIMLGADDAMWLRRRAIGRRVREAGARLGLAVDPDALVADLALGRRQRVEILKSVLRGAHLLILDEPTSNLAPDEIAGLMTTLRRLRDEGRGVVFISHKLGEVLEICDEVVVLRAGRVVARRSVVGASRAQLAAAMIGGEAASAPHSGRRAAVGTPRLVARGLRGRGLEAGIDLSVRGGEILGVAGVDGNGQDALVELLAGMRRAAGGSLLLDGQDITHAPVGARVRAGLATVPADRRGTALVPAMTIAENLRLRGRHRDADPRALMAAFDIRAAGPSAPVATLSGGNQQKVVLARELGGDASVLVAHQATWGLDPGASRFVLDRIMALRDAGGAALFISSEIEEILQIADRVAVLFGGRLVGVADRCAVSRDRLGLLMSGEAA